MKILILITILGISLAEEQQNLEQLLEAENRQFTWKLFTEVVKENPDKSVVLSAFSVLEALAYLSLAASGAGHDEILKTIGIPNDNMTKEVFPLVNKRLRAVKGVELKIANKIYIPENYKLNEKLVVELKTVFGSEAKNVDFTKSAETAADINNWVEDQTNHKIKNLVSADKLDMNTRAVLVNALYFKGNWKDKFNARRTRDADFHVANKVVKVPMMFRNGNYKYAESKELDAKLLEIPYEGEEATFLIVLPNQIDGLTSLQEKLKDNSLLEKAIQSMIEVELDVFIPKFKIETTTDLKKVLMNVGIKDLFDSSRGILDNLLENQSGLYVSDAIQKAFIEINEDGAEAAAANAFGVSLLSAIIDSLSFKANHPFVYFLKAGNTIIFNGIFQS